jgi:hypothetical protein
LLRFPNDLGIVAVLDLLVPGDDESRFEGGNLVQVGDPLRPFGSPASPSFFAYASPSSRSTSALPLMTSAGGSPASSSILARSGDAVVSSR